MDNFKEFTGKQLDDCIKEACTYFDCSREKLEIEIIQDAKTGIFGIVGARKAKLRARRLQLPPKMLTFLEQPLTGNKPAKKRNQEKVSKAPQRKPYSEKTPCAKKSAPGDLEKMEETAQISLPEDEKKEEAVLNQLDSEEVASRACETVARLLSPIAGKEIVANARIAHGRVRVNVRWEGDAGLLIGRAGQTLASLQYIASRILSHRMNAGVRVQLEIGEYKSRQDEKIRERAHMLAQKVRQTGKSWSTQPLSSYHRRIIHMELQNEPGIYTRSFGEGIMKKVIIAPAHGGESAS